MIRRTFLLAGLVLACRAPGEGTPGPELAASSSAVGFSALELVETAPLGTTLDHPDLRETHEVWLEMIEGARWRIDLGHFYASDRARSRLERVVEALEHAAARGVRVRFLAEASFHETYPETLARLGARPEVSVRLLDLRSRTGGILHAKYMLVDGREAYLGSANFDWRSLEHIQELGVRFGARASVQALSEVFETDWRLAGGEPDGPRRPELTDAHAFPEICDEGGERLRLTPVFSPRELLADPRLWDLPRLVEMIDGAREELLLQLLSYKTRARRGEYFDELDAALRRAASRGVRVRLLLADWSKRAGTIEALQSLEPVPNIEVRLVSIPPAAEGFIPFARVVHAKYLVADRERSWIGTSNWERGYFHESRNVGLLVDSPRIGARLGAFFEDLWSSAYAEPVDPARRYQPPRVSRLSAPTEAH